MFGYREKTSPADTAAIWAIVLLAAAVAALVGIYFARQNDFWGLGSASDSGITPNVIVPASESVTTADTSEEAVEITSVTVNKTEVSVTEETEDTAAFSAEVSTEYDIEFFDTALMIGDSLSVGFVNYGYLKPENVFAQVGLTPASVMNTDINGESVYAKAENLNPRHICVMLGTNGLSYLSADYMAEKTGEFIDGLRQVCPDAEIALLSIPPVTAVHESEKPEKLENITDYNSRIAKTAEEKSVKFVDIYSLLQDENGYLADHYAENDGLHFKTYAYPVILSAVQSSAGENFSPDNAVPAEASVPDVTAIPETAAITAYPEAETATTDMPAPAETETEEYWESDEIIEVTIYPEDWDEIY